MHENKRANEISFHMNSSAAKLVLAQMQNKTRKWLILRDRIDDIQFLTVSSSIVLTPSSNCLLSAKPTALRYKSFSRSIKTSQGEEFFVLKTFLPEGSGAWEEVLVRRANFK